MIDMIRNNKAWMRRKSSMLLHIDMNSYFATVEQQANPYLRGKAVGVCAYLSANGCIIASSIEAKKKGVKTGMRVKIAKALIPDMIFIESDPSKYRSVTRQIFHLLSDYCQHIEAYSIDEAFMDFSYLGKNTKAVIGIAQEIQERIKQEIGEYLKCSIGISHTKFLAKFASDQALPDTIFLLTPQNINEVLSQAKLTDAWGINIKTAYKLQALGIYTLLDLKRHSVSNLMSVFGKWGYVLWAQVNGVPIQPLMDRKTTQPKSIGHSYCLPKQTVDRKFLLPILYKLCEKTGTRLRAIKKKARLIHVGCRYTNGTSFQVSKKQQISFDSTQDIFYAAKCLFSQKWTIPVTFLSITVSGLHEDAVQISLFTSTKQKRVFQVIDQVNEKYGEYTLYSGALCKTKSYAKDSIGFRKSLYDF